MEFCAALLNICQSTFVTLVVYIKSMEEIKNCTAMSVALKEAFHRAARQGEHFISFGGKASKKEKHL